jgi:hypothetical protein
MPMTVVLAPIEQYLPTVVLIGNTLRVKEKDPIENKKLPFKKLQYGSIRPLEGNTNCSFGLNLPCTLQLPNGVK